MLALFDWRDPLEIIFFSTIIYYWCLWLKKDQTKNLLPTFYGYWLVTCVAYLADLTAISTFLVHIAPVSLLLFIVLHQELLQRNFVSFSLIQQKKSQTFEWLDLLIRSCLQAMTHKKQIIYIVQRNDALEPFISSTLRLNTDLQLNLISLLLEDESAENNILLVNQEGALLASNVALNFSLPDTWTTQEAENLTPLEKKIVHLSAKTDALIIRSTMHTTFDIIAQGKMVPEINATNALRIMKKLIIQRNHTKEVHEVHYTQKESNQQPHA